MAHSLIELIGAGRANLVLGILLLIAQRVLIHWLPVEDQLTGFYSYASVGVAVTQKGLVELSPTGIAIGPFNFTTLWTSQLGQGSIFQRSVVQYGQNGYLVTDSGAYSVSTGGGFKEITGTAKQAIFNSIQTANPENKAPFLFSRQQLLVVYFYTLEIMPIRLRTM